MAVGLMVVFTLIPILLGLIVVVWLWVTMLSSLRQTPLGIRGRTLTFAKVALTLSVLMDCYFMFGHTSSSDYAKLPVFGSLLLAIASAVLALLGEGRGRVLTFAASCGLALSWLPFVLP